MTTIASSAIEDWICLPAAATRNIRNPQKSLYQWLIYCARLVRVQIKCEASELSYRVFGVGMAGLFLRRVALAVGLIVLASPGTGRADYLVDSDLRSAIKGKTLKARTAKDGDAWQVRLTGSGRAEFMFANGGSSLARWRVVGKRIEFVFDQSNEKTCRAIFIAAGKRQEWHECDSARVSSYIIEPTFTVAKAASTDPSVSIEVERKLRVEAEALQSRGYATKQLAATEVVKRASAMRRSYNFRGGSTYAVVAACDENCSHVQLMLYAPGGKIMAQSPERHHTVIVSGPADQTGSYEAVVMAPGCEKEQCAVGLQLMRFKPGSSDR